MYYAFALTHRYDCDRFIIAMSTTGYAYPLPTLQAIVLWHT
ncbi:MAG: hypothetical protein RMY28_001035 [Nostoc sp. ChiSLP01]|nr:hypothetical protein [Nostoc sp. CmiSLP01]MDZ8282884.1 hypothetical protein [Nostoc sp. ChiSLP01]